MRKRRGHGRAVRMVRRICAGLRGDEEMLGFSVDSARWGAECWKEVRRLDAAGPDDLIMVDEDEVRGVHFLVVFSRLWSLLGSLCPFPDPHTTHQILWVLV